MSRRVRRFAFVATVGASLAMVAPALAASSGTATTSLGQTLSASINTPADQAHFTVGSELNVRGTVSLTGGTTVIPTNVGYMIDVSGSTSDFCKPTDPADTRTVLDCEQEGAIALNGSLSGAPQTEAAVMSFDDLGYENQDFVPTSSPLINTAINGLAPGGGTNYDAALTQIATTFAGLPSGNRKVVFFLSDGAPTTFTTGPGSPLADVAALGIIVNTYSVGDGAIRCPEPNSPLKVISDTTSGQCNDVEDPSQLAANLTNARVDVTMNGGTPIPAQVSGNNWSVDFTQLNGHTVRLGNNPIVATATAPDGTRLQVNITVIGDPPPTTTTTQAPTTTTSVQVVQVTPRFTG
jgi:hypothetical protein